MLFSISTFIDTTCVPVCCKIIHILAVTVWSQPDRQRCHSCLHWTSTFVLKCLQESFCFKSLRQKENGMYVASVISTFMAVKFRHLAVSNVVTAFFTPPSYMICVVGYWKLFYWDILHCLWVFIAHCFIGPLTIQSIYFILLTIMCIGYPWRWGHYMVSKFWALNTQSWCTVF